MYLSVLPSFFLSCVLRHSLFHSLSLSLSSLSLFLSLSLSLSLSLCLCSPCCDAAQSQSSNRTVVLKSLEGDSSIVDYPFLGRRKSEGNLKSWRLRMLWLAQKV